jgi:hypothetical protein
MRLSPVTAVLVLSVNLAACSGEIEQEGFCTFDARASVVVSVVDPQSKAVEDARVTFSLDGGPDQQAECSAGGGTSGSCARWTAERERAGDFLIKVTSADGKHSAQQQISVGEDRCHVITETVAITLPNAP